ncbi:MAG: XRE family transcriptional regulator [Alphaproteobacteria bacterium]|nr:MAG: XRE family transcriptional regulator [Alphaproteobacteria bacterium]
MPHPIDISVGERLRAIRRQRGLTQSELGGTLGLTFQQIQKYERGANRISASRLALLANALAVPVGAFFEDGDTAGIDRNEDEIQELVTCFERMSPALKEDFVRLIDTIAANDGRPMI